MILVVDDDEAFPNKHKKYSTETIRCSRLRMRIEHSS